MFDNVGGTIKSVAKVVCWFGIILSIILGVSLISSGTRINNDRNTRGMGTGTIMLGGLILLAGPIGSWLGCLSMYALGQLVENSDICAEYITNMKNEQEKNKAHAGMKTNAAHDSIVAPDYSKEPSEIMENQKQNKESPVWERDGRNRVICPNCGNTCNYSYLTIYEKCPKCGQDYKP